MKTVLLPMYLCGAPVFATWSMRPPLVCPDLLIFVTVTSCILLFWVKSSVMLKQEMYDRLHGPGKRSAPLEWWEADLDPILKKAVILRLKAWLENRAARRAPRSAGDT